MAKLLKLRRGTTSDHSSFTGAEGEVTVDTTKDTLVVHDGSTAGGHPLAKEGAAAATLDITGTNTASSNSGGWYYPLFTDNYGAGKTVYNDQSGQIAFNPETNVLQVSNLTVDGDVTLTGDSNNVVWDKSDNSLEFADNALIKLGTDGDLHFYHTGSHAYLKNTTGTLYIQDDSAVIIGSVTNTHSYVKGVYNGATELFHANSVKVTTTATGVDVTGTAVLDGITIDGAYEQVAEAVGALDIDCSTGNYFTKTINANSTFTFSNPAASGTVTSFTLELTHTSGTVTWPTEVKWNGDTAPTLATGKTHLFMFVTDDGGTRWRGSALVDYVN